MAGDPQFQKALALYREGRLGESGAACKQYLQRHPRDVEAIRLYARLAEGLGKSEEAILIYRKLLALAPRDAPSLAALSWHYYQGGDYHDARQAAEQALALSPRLATPHWVLGAVALAEGAEAQGLEWLEQARSLGLDERVVDGAIFQDLVARGRFTEAADLARRLVKRWPTNAAQYAKLAQVADLAGDDGDRRLVRSLLDAGGRLRPEFTRDEEDLADACQALYQLALSEGDSERAWQHLETMKGPSRRAFPPESRLKACADFGRLKTLFTRDFLAARQSCGAVAPDPLFIIGMPRSGTTLLERVLATAPGVEPAGERPELSRLQQALCARYGRNQYALEALAQVPPEAWAGLGEAYVEQVRRSLPASAHFIDKMPGNFIHVGLICVALPRAKLVHIHRDPMATCFSLYERNFGVLHPYNLDLESLGHYYLQYRDLMDHWREVAPGKLIDLRYEELVSDPEAVISRLGEQLGLRLDAAALAEAQGTGTIRTASYWQARQPVHSGSIERWKAFRRQLEPLAEILAPVR